MFKDNIEHSHESTPACDPIILFGSHVSPSFLTPRRSKTSQNPKAKSCLYSSLNNEQIVTLVDAFQKKYPAIKPSFYRGTSERVLQRAVTEAQSRAASQSTSSRRRAFNCSCMKGSGTDATLLCRRKHRPTTKASKIPTATGSACIRCSIRWRYNTQLVRPNEAPKNTKICSRPVGKAGSASTSWIPNGT